MKATDFFPSAELLRVLDRREIAVWEVHRGRPGGNLTSSALGLGTQFRDFRRYTPGDDLRYLDWNVLGRLGEPFVKQFAREEAGRLSLLVDRTASVAVEEGVPRTVCGAAVVLAYIGLRSGYRVDVFPVPPDPARDAGGPVEFFGRGAASDLLAWLGDLEFGVAAPLDVALRHAVGGHELGTASFLLSDLADPAAGGQILRFLRARRGQPAVIHVVARPDTAWLQPGHRELVDPETGRTLRVRITPGLRRAYLTRLKRFQDEVRHRCRALGIRHVELEAGQSPDREMLLLLQRAGLLK